jgi:hypothetical protein
MRLSSICLVVAVIVAGGSAWADKKEKIAILGLEVQGNTTQVDTESTRVAQDLTVALRTHPKSGKGPYLYAGQSGEKELVDEKIMNNCPDEKPDCMAKIGKALGTHYLVYGKIERKQLSGQAGYQVSLKMLKVETAQQMPGWTEFVPLNESQGVKLQDWARRGYKKLTNDFDGGTLAIKIRNEGFDRGTILIDGDERGNIIGGNGEVPSLPEGRYQIAILANGFERWESDEKVTIRNGETTTEEITLKRSTKDCDPRVSKDCGGTVSQDGGGRGLWRGMFVAGIVIGGGGGAFALYERSQKLDYSKGGKCAKEPFPCPEGNDIVKIKAQGEKLNDRQTIGAVVAGVGAGIAVIGFIKGFVVGGSKEKLATTKRKHGPTDMVIAPVITGDTSGATLQFRW